MCDEGVRHPVFDHEGLQAGGEVLVSEFEAAKAALISFMEPGERWALLLSHIDPKDKDYGHLTLQTVSGTDRSRGRVIYLERNGAAVKFVGAYFWIE